MARKKAESEEAVDALALAKELNERVQSFKPWQGVNSEGVHWLHEKCNALVEALGGEPIEAAKPKKFKAPGIPDTDSEAETML